MSVSFPVSSNLMSVTRSQPLAREIEARSRFQIISESLLQNPEDVIQIVYQYCLDKREADFVMDRDQAFFFKIISPLSKRPAELVHFSQHSGVPFSYLATRLKIAEELQAKLKLDLSDDGCQEFTKLAPFQLNEMVQAGILSPANVRFSPEYASNVAAFYSGDSKDLYIPCQLHLVGSPGQPSIRDFAQLTPALMLQAIQGLFFHPDIKERCKIFFMFHLETSGDYYDGSSFGEGPDASEKDREELLKSEFRLINQAIFKRPNHASEEVWMSKIRGVFFKFNKIWLKRRAGLLPEELKFLPVEEATKTIANI